MRSRDSRGDSLARREGLDAHAGADERDHDRDAEREEQDLQDVGAVFAEREQVAEGPPAREGGAEDFRRDQDRGGQHGRDVDPVDAALAARTVGGVKHGAQ